VAAPSEAAAPASSAATTDKPAAAWDPSWTKEQKMAFMKEHVIPAMTPVLQAYDAKEFAKVTCEACHGPKYVAPQKFLPKLTMKNGQITAFQDHPKDAKIMAEQFVPVMAKAMGMPAYDPATKQGFGCGGCHAIEVK
jgi:cytochrome c551/c552